MARSSAAISRRWFMVSLFTWELAEITSPASRAFLSARMAAAWLPRLPRILSCMRARPSTDTPSPSSPAFLKALARSRVKLRPPVCMVTRTPCEVSRSMICSQSSRRYASPPIRVTSRAPRRPSESQISIASSVVSSFGRALPARVPQWPHAWSHNIVISHTV